MYFKQAGQIQYLGFDSLDKEGLFHAIVTRQQGVSPHPWQSLNLGGSGGDEPSRVVENRRLVFHAFNLDYDCIYDVWQVHGDNVICTDGPRIVDTPHQKADAILTDCPNITLLMLFADCVPILLYDPIQKVVGIAHAGWKGTVLKVATKTVEQMCACYGSKPSNILAAIGPSIGPDHYSVGDDVIRAVKDAFGSAAGYFIEYRNGAVKFNLWESNRYLLEQIGVEQIEVAGICTACNTGEWFSHRAEHGRTGRFGVLIGLRV
jgi:YfiH family protein